MTDREFAGKPITGDYTPNSIFEAEQKPLGELIELLDKALALPNVKSVKWSQSTPYFNDGEPCVFSAEGWSTVFRVDHNGSVEDFGENAEFDFETYEPGWGYDDQPRISYTERAQHLTKILDGVDYTEHDQTKDEVIRALDSGSYDKELLKFFGDHATIEYNGSGFNVEFYEHD